MTWTSLIAAQNWPVWAANPGNRRDQQGNPDARARLRPLAPILSSTRNLKTCLCAGSPTTQSAGKKKKKKRKEKKKRKRRPPRGRPQAPEAPPWPSGPRSVSKHLDQTYRAHQGAQTSWEAYAFFQLNGTDERPQGRLVMWRQCLAGPGRAAPGDQRRPHRHLCTTHQRAVEARPSVASNAAACRIAKCSHDRMCIARSPYAKHVHN
ncbi:hypothetical protein MAPG_05915 [Magnaporthiopsis poae ATCC 64411]|uniref:Uncharacterized protein n=1 Tax=Magnaporthiopsis poae (strain ATCC 64411 / 73-15) TaxID=644358 RepID=A0A0C4E0N4_MAGP6|nr:hypothetical protein MAPG_05915 [Magnaporthiopsis poae ATCC 64411]